MSTAIQLGGRANQRTTRLYYYGMIPFNNVGAILFRNVKNNSQQTERA